MLFYFFIISFLTQCKLKNLDEYYKVKFTRIYLSGNLKAGQTTDFVVIDGNPKAICCTIYSHSSDTIGSTYTHWTPQVDGNSCRFMKCTDVQWSATAIIIALY